MKKIIITIAIVFSSVLSLYAQTGTVEGKVLSANNPVSNVTVTVSGTGKGVTTDAAGWFEIKDIKEGNYTLNFSYLGYKSQSIPIKISAGETLNVPDIILEEKQEQLNEVVLQENRKNKFSRTESVYVSKLPLKNLENPQVYTTVSSELLNEQIITSFDDALNNVPGLQKLWESTGRGTDGAGYFSMRGFSVQPTLLNGLPALTNGSPDPANIEAIEAIKGPSGTLYGSSVISYGGIINIVTKKPYDTFGGELSYTTGSFGLNRITADINTPLDDNGNILFRLNTAYHTENSFQDAGFKKSFFVAPTLSFKASDKLSFLLVSEFLSLEGTNPLMIFLDRANPLTVTSFDEFNYDYDRSYTSNDLTTKNPTSKLQAQMNYKISDSWTSQTAVSTSSAQTKGYYSYIYEGSQPYYPGISNGSVFTRLVSRQNSTTLSTDIQQNFIGDFNIGTLRNRVVIGADYFQRNTTNNNTPYLANGLVYMGYEDPATVYDAVYGGEEVTDFDSGLLSQPAMDALLADSDVSNTESVEKIFGAYISDVINISPALAVMASLRVDSFEGDPDDDDDDQVALSPKFGATYQPIIDKLSVFANYMNGFNNVAARQVADADGSNPRLRTFDPEQANQLEFGIKTNLFRNRINATLSYYNIKVSDKVMTDPANLNNSIQDGEVESKGIELDVVANPVDGWNIVLGYSYNDSEILKGSTNVGTRPLEAGPESLFNIWTSYKFQENTSLEGFGLGFGANASGKALVINYDTTGELEFPDYIIFNSTIFYEAEKYRIGLKVNNITNEEYFKGWTTINPQKTRNILASFSYKF